MFMIRKLRRAYPEVILNLAAEIINIYIYIFTISDSNQTYRYVMMVYKYNFYSCRHYLLRLDYVSVY
jgi:hypothetical protein